MKGWHRNWKTNLFANTKTFHFTYIINGISLLPRWPLVIKIKWFDRHTSAPEAGKIHKLFTSGKYVKKEVNKLLIERYVDINLKISHECAILNVHNL